MSEKANTKVENEKDRFDVSDVLAITAVIINDLKQRRSKNYSFAWENALHSKGDSGIKLQYTHAR
jgi:arginyl-tRNA synthetase